MFIRFCKGLYFFGIHSHVLRPMSTIFFFLSSFVFVVIDVKKAISLLYQRVRGRLERAVSFDADLRFKVTCYISYLSFHGRVPLAPIPMPSHAAAIKFNFKFILLQHYLLNSRIQKSTRGTTIHIDAPM